MKDRMTANEFQAIIRGKNFGGTSISQGNRKVINATKTEDNGVVFDSRLERHMHDLLKSHGIGFIFQKKYTLQEPFKYNGETIRAITYTVDFLLPDYDIVIDTKGIVTQQGQLRIKMLKNLFHELGRNTKIELPRTKSDCEELVRSIVSDR